MAHHWLAIAALGRGAPGEALAAASAGALLTGRDPWSIADLALAHAAVGEPVAAEAAREELRGPARDGFVQPTILAVAAVATGRVDEAFYHLADAFETSDPPALMLRQFPSFDPLRGDRRFPALLREAGWR